MVRAPFHNTVHGALMLIRLMRGVHPNLLNPAHYRIAPVIFTEGHCSSYASFNRTRPEHPEFAQNMIALATLDPRPSLVERSAPSIRTY